MVPAPRDGRSRRPTRSPAPKGAPSSRSPAALSSTPARGASGPALRRGAEGKGPGARRTARVVGPERVGAATQAAGRESRQDAVSCQGLCSGCARRGRRGNLLKGGLADGCKQPSAQPPTPRRTTRTSTLLVAPVEEMGLLQSAAPYLAGPARISWLDHPFRRGNNARKWRSHANAGRNDPATPVVATDLALEERVRCWW
jgi:hypothetical protein